MRNAKTVQFNRLLSCRSSNKSITSYSRNSNRRSSTTTTKKSNKIIKKTLDTKLKSN